jgi:hypothetical protein
MSFVSSKKLTKKERDILCSQIEEHFEESHERSPIYDSQRISKLKEAFEELNIKYFPKERKAAINQEYDMIKSYLKAMIGDNVDIPYQELKDAIFSGDTRKLEDLMRAIKEDMVNKKQEDNDEWDDYEFNYYQDENETTAVKDVFKASQLNKMYKKIANKIHPDKELDPNKIDEKKKLMQQLSEAKTNKDVFTLIKMYQEYVPDGEFFLDEDGMKNVLHLLQMNIYKLNQEHRDIFNGQGMKTAIWKTYSSTSKKKTSEKFNKSLDAIKEMTNELKQMIVDWNTIPKIKNNVKSLKNQYYY